MIEIIQPTGVKVFNAKNRKKRPMNTNDLVYMIAARAAVLADLDLPTLRRVVESKQGHSKRGALIEEQLTEEFCQEYPKEIVEA